LQPDRFEQTQWSLVLAAGAADSGADAALATLCRNYWYPLYAYVRQRGSSHHDAEDLTQAFFGKLLEKNYVGAASRERGRFRTFLLTSLRNFLANEWDHRSARKRGGGVVFIPLDADAADRFEREAQTVGARNLNPEQYFARQWAHAVLDRALISLGTSYSSKGQAALFEALKPSITLGADAVPQARVAAELGMETNAVKVAAHRLRQRYREILREEIAQTLESEADVEEEFHVLREVLSGE
jgi:RNA polymerase sigma-70 factor (ECF subfamily)